MFSKICIIHIYIYIYVYKRFSTILDKGLRNNILKKREEMEKLENINEMGALNMKEKNRNKQK